MAIVLEPLFRKKTSKEEVLEVSILERDEQPGSRKESPVLKSQRENYNSYKK